jgi:hypothetical protein
MMALDGFILVLILPNVLVEGHPMLLSQVIGFLIDTCGGTYAGALMASLTAKRTAARQVKLARALRGMRNEVAFY